MATPNFANVKRGDRVKILSGSGHVGRIVELRGPLGPKGMQIYRVLLRKKPKPAYVEVREDQLELLGPT
jgi:ribosomal protein L24